MFQTDRPPVCCRRLGAAQLEVAVSTWTHKLVGGAWRAWSAARTSGQLRRDALERAARLWRSRALAGAWRAWRAGVERSAVLAVRVGPIIGGSVVSSPVYPASPSCPLCACFPACHSRIEVRTRGQIGLERVGEGWERRLTTCSHICMMEICYASSCLGRLQHRFEAAAFAAWVDEVAAKQQRRSALELACKHWQKAALRAVHAGWQQSAAHLREQHHAAMRAVSFFRSAQLHRGFAKWLGAVTSIRAKRDSATHAEHSMRMYHARRGLATWRDTVATKHDRLNAAHRALARMAHRSLSLAFGFWRCRTAQKCALQQTALRAVTMMTQRTVCVGFRCWRGVAVEKWEQQRVAVRVLAAMRINGLRRAFNGWQEGGAWLRDSGTKLEACLMVRLAPGRLASPHAHRTGRGSLLAVASRSFDTLPVVR